MVGSMRYRMDYKEVWGKVGSMRYRVGGTEYKSMVVGVMMTSMRDCVRYMMDYKEVWEMRAGMMKFKMRELLMRYMMDYKEVWEMRGSMVKFKMRELLMTRDKREL
jgi:hypothetical protein